MWRHTFCTRLAGTGADAAVIRELAGHADIRTTTVYTALSSGFRPQVCGIQQKSLVAVPLRRGRPGNCVGGFDG
ncbi:MAG: Phage integrase family [Baekduia sp.]|jgi:hypothetical protein|nr:Phage integrase family [Baekduia sp.]